MSIKSEITRLQDAKSVLRYWLMTKNVTVPGLSLIHILMRSENFEMALDELVWLITLLANQSVLIHNLQTPEDKQELLTQETVELLTSPLELAEYKSAIMEAMFKGTKRNVQSENNSKNAHGRGTQVP